MGIAVLVPVSRVSASVDKEYTLRAESRTKRRSKFGRLSLITISLPNHRCCSFCSDFTCKFCLLPTCYWDVRVFFSIQATSKTPLLRKGTEKLEKLEKRREKRLPASPNDAREISPVKNRQLPLPAPTARSPIVQNEQNSKPLSRQAGPLTTCLSPGTFLVLFGYSWVLLGTLAMSGVLLQCLYHPGIIFDALL